MICSSNCDDIINEIYDLDDLYHVPGYMAKREPPGN